MVLFRVSLYSSVVRWCGGGRPMLDMEEGGGEER